jgi:hypothetical protein
MTVSENKVLKIVNKLFFQKYQKVGISCLICLLFKIIFLRTPKSGKIIQLDFPYYHLRSYAISQNLIFLSERNKGGLLNQAEIRTSLKAESFELQFQG